MKYILNENFFKFFLVICLVPAAFLIGKVFLLFLPVIFWVLAYMAFKKKNNNEALMWIVFAVIALIFAFIV
ncbi:MAG: hypothetical protein H2071_03905 [SAR86 cluster bacterium]|nr:hypothetical protein [SAR86 cluster bacterium]|tara:strand:+ start:646 stop:858 length:213 start_codon:yes stop_codon:yes gene_type:complete